MKRYDPKTLEPHWQRVWADTKLYAARDDNPRPKYYYLVEFPYPSGEGLHVGHVLSYTALDIMARHKRMQGFNVLYPMGWDAFGLPTENYAIKTKQSPQAVTKRNTDRFRSQLQSLGISFDWDREINTSDPSYYKWTQWIFLQLLKKGLAYQAEIAINWCPFEKTGLANEEVVDGKHERCGTPVERKLLKQWVLKITAYADRLAEDLKSVDYLDRISSQQINWIGRSEGAEITWKLGPKQGDSLPKETPSVTVYTTRPDTLFGATFLVVSPELAKTWLDAGWQPAATVRDYITQALNATELSRQETRDKTGVDTGLRAIHPLTGEPVPVWVADYVLGSYGTGAIMAVPAHDERDFEFARTFDLPIKPVVQAPKTGQTALILHGTGGNDKKAWYPWLREQLETLGYEVFVPNMPDSAAPDLKAWLAALKPYAAKLNDQSLIIGHSLGGHTAAHFILENQLHIKKLLLVAPTFPEMDWDAYVKRHHDHNAHHVRAASSVALDWKALSDAVQDIIVYGSKTDPYIPYDKLAHHTSIDLPRAQFVSFDDMHHFGTGGGITQLPTALGVLVESTVATGPLTSSAEFNGLEGTEAKRAIVKALYDKGVGKGATKYKLRDWIFSRQHYWGEPIPVIHCPKDGAVPVPEDQLPVELPPVEHYEPTDTGESPLAAITDWVNTTCPQCGGPAKRETDTMPNWAGSSWYFLRYTDPHNDTAFASPEALEHWTPVDLYNGGMEHTTLHLLYSRFWHKFLYDQGLVPTPEPYAKRTSHGMILGPDGQKMSKSRGNVINPDRVVAQYGADTIRLYEMFMGPFDEAKSWSEEHLAGVSRFLYRVWTLAQDLIEAHNPADPAARTAPTGPAQTGTGTFATGVDRKTHATLKRVHDHIGAMSFNLMVSALMEFINFLSEPKTKAALLEPANAAVATRTLRTLVLMLAPGAPHLAEELWHQMGEEGSVHAAAWPAYDPQALKEDVITVVVQVNGKVRANLVLPADATDDDLKAAAQADPKVAAHLDGAEVVKTIVVPRKLVNFVIKPRP